MLVWPRSSIDIHVQFTPDMTGSHAATLFCQVQGRQSRLPCQLKGEANGPRAKFSFDIMEMQNIFINTSSTYTTYLTNFGDIPINFELQPSNSIFGPMFSFEPSAGTLAVGAKQDFKIHFNAKQLGEIDEMFIFGVMVRFELTIGF